VKRLTDNLGAIVFAIVALAGLVLDQIDSFNWAMTTPFVHLEPDRPNCD
jgi:hypothetical protein